MAKNVFRASFSLSISRGAACALHSIRIHVRSSVCECVCLCMCFAYLFIIQQQQPIACPGRRTNFPFSMSSHWRPIWSFAFYVATFQLRGCACVRHSQLARYLHICSVFMILLISEHTQLFMLSHIMYTPCGAKCNYFALFFSVAMLG